MYRLLNVYMFAGYKLYIIITIIINIIINIII